MSKTLEKLVQIVGWVVAFFCFAWAGSHLLGLEGGTLSVLRAAVLVLTGLGVLNVARLIVRKYGRHGPT